MRTKTLCNAKLVVDVQSNKKEQSITTLSVFDNRTKKLWTDKQIEERGIISFLNVANMKETLNWNLNGDDTKYQFKWRQSGKTFSQGRAYIFN